MSRRGDPVAVLTHRTVRTRRASPREAAAGGQRAAPRRQEPPDLPHDIEYLQRTVGNQAVRRLLTGGHALPTPARAPALQRKTTPEYGLALPKSINPFAKKATQLWKSNQKMTLGDFAKELIQVIKPELAALGIPPVKWTADSGLGTDGSFDSEHWELKYNPAKFSQDGSAAILGDLHPEEARNAAGTLYHEARHADQDVLIIRVLLGEKKTPAEIVTQTKINKAAVLAVARYRYKGVPSKDQATHARRMIAVMYGEHSQLLKFMMANGKAIDEFQNLMISAASDSASIRAALAKAKPHVGKFLDWGRNVLGPRIGELQKTKPKAGTQAAAVLNGLIAINATLAAFAPQWAAINANPKPTAAEFQGLKALATAFIDVFVGTYRGLEGEADAFEVEAVVKGRLEASIPDDEP